MAAGPPRDRHRLALIAGPALLALAACAPAPAPQIVTPAPAAATIETALARHIEVLASDAFGGRRPGTEGEAMTLDYLAREWREAGLQSGTNDPAHPWYAPVDLVRTVPGESRVVVQSRSGRDITLSSAQAIALSQSGRALVEQAPVVLVGTDAMNMERPDLAGKVAALAPEVELGDAEREALYAHGAVAIVHIVGDETALAAEAARRSMGGYRLASGTKKGLEAWITRDALAGAIGPRRFARLLERASGEGAEPVALPVRITVEANTELQTIETHNLIGRLPGRNPDAGAVLLMGHWDHFGTCGEEGAADRLCNGAVDNASGLAVLTELARTLAAGPRLDRDVYFLATTAEEWGLLGTRAFIEEPPLPLDTIVAAFNLDSVAAAPADERVGLVGEGLTPLDPVILEEIALAGLQPGDRELARRYVRRQDAWALLQAGVPAVMVSGAFGDAEALAPYIAGRYHNPSDEADVLELSGAVQDYRLHLALVRRLADADAYRPGGGE